MSGDAPQAPTQTTQTVLSPEQRAMMDMAMPGLKEWMAKGPPQMYGGSTVAGFTPEQLQAQQMTMGAAGQQDKLASNAADTSNYWMGGDVWNPDNSANKGLRSAIDAATRPIAQNFAEVINPAIGDAATKVGGFGSSRHGLAQVGAAGRTAQAIGDTSAKLAQDAYSTNVDAQMKALGLLPNTQSAQTTGARSVGAVGDVQQAMNQALLGEQISRFNYDEWAPFLQSKEIMSLLTGLPGGSTVSTGSVPTSSTAQKALGGAASGAALGGTLGSVIPGLGTLIGAGGGALIGGAMPFVFS